MNVLITSLGSNTSIGVVKALKTNHAFEHLRLIGTDTNEKYLCAGAAMVDVFYKTPSVVDAELYERSLLEIIKKENVDCVIPIHDFEIEFVSQLAQRFPYLTFWAVNEPETINLCNNKQSANEIARAYLLNVPDSVLYDPDRVDARTLQFPVIAKPLNGVSSRGISILKTFDEFKIWQNTVKGEYMLQEFIAEGIEYTVDCYNSYKGQFIGGVVRRRVEVKDGIATKAVIEENEELLSKCRALLEAIKYKGASNIQFLLKNNVYYFIEINPRFAGAGVLSYLHGLNAPLFTILESVGDTDFLNNRLDIRAGTYMTRYWNEVFYDRAGNHI